MVVLDYVRFVTARRELSNVAINDLFERVSLSVKNDDGTQGLVRVVLAAHDNDLQCIQSLSYRPVSGTHLCIRDMNELPPLAFRRVRGIRLKSLNCIGAKTKLVDAAKDKH